MGSSSMSCMYPHETLSVFVLRTQKRKRFVCNYECREIEGFIRSTPSNIGWIGAVRYQCHLNSNSVFSVYSTESLMSSLFW